MGVRDNTTYRIDCDRCGYHEDSDEDPRTVHLGGWSWCVGPDGPWGTEQRLLCGSCLERLKLFFEGDRTVAGQAYNDKDNQRFLKAKRAAAEYVDAERNAPWNN